jgi:hypothetical protein
MATLRRIIMHMAAYPLVLNTHPKSHLTFTDPSMKTNKSHQELEIHGTVRVGGRGQRFIGTHKTAGRWFEWPWKQRPPSVKITRMSDSQSPSSNFSQTYTNRKGKTIIHALPEKCPTSHGPPSPPPREITRKSARSRDYNMVHRYSD